MRRALAFHAASCTGCLSCMVNCALAHEGINALSSARLRIDFHPFEPQWPAVYCRQCTRAPCATACPAGAIQRHASLEYWFIDYDACTGCQLCIAACPFNALSFDHLTNKVIKCDACEGDPICVRSCPAGALHWRDITDRAPIQKIMKSS